MSALRLRTATTLALLFAAVPASADTLHVDANLATGANDGSDWANAYQGSDGLQAALLAAVSGDEIWVADGVYLPTSSASRTVSFQLKNGVEIYGGFAGGEASVNDRPAFGVAPSILSADLGGNDGSNVYTDNSYHVLNGQSTNATAVINGFTVRGGNANGSGNNNKGGGILCLPGSSPTVELCRFEDNRCTFGGGAGYVNGNPTFTDCEFIDNQGGSFGGAFDIANAGSVRFDRCWFEGNRAARAGALEIFSSNGVRVTNSVFKDNTSTASGGGGAMWFGFSSSCVVVNNTVVGNTATSNTAGGLLVSSTSITVANNIFWDNEGPGGAQNSANQISGTSSVSYCIVEGGFAGTGNLGTAPSFVNAAGDDYRLAAGSVGIDAGRNSLVPSGITLDKAGNPRFWDVQTVPDTGNGSAPIVDIGAYEDDTPPVSTSFCYGDQLGTLCPCGNDHFPGTPEGCANSQGWGGKLAASGSNVYANDDLVLTVTQGRANQPSMIVQGSAAISTVFKDGILCMGNPTERVEVVFLDASGSGSTVTSILTGGNVPGPGVTRYYQAWYRDPAISPCGTGSNFTSALQVDWL